TSAIAIEPSPRTLDSLVADGSLSAEVGALVIAAGQDDLTILKGMGRLCAAIVVLDCSGDVQEVTHWMRGRGFSNFALLGRGTIVFLHDVHVPHLMAALVRAATHAHDNLLQQVPGSSGEQDELTDLMQRQTRLLE